MRKRRIHKIIYLILNKIITKYHNLAVFYKSSNCKLDIESRLYPESDIINLQNNPLKILIGKNTHIRGTLLIYPYGNGISIGDNSYIGEHTVIRAANEIKIGSNVLIAHNVTIIDTDSHELNAKQRAASFKRMLKEGHPKSPGEVRTSPIYIDDYAWISYGVSILKGVHIGEGSIVGAGSVVAKDIPPYTIVAGNPAKIIRKLSADHFNKQRNSRIDNRDINSNLSSKIKKESNNAENIEPEIIDCKLYNVTAFKSFNDFASKIELWWGGGKQL